MDVAGKHLVWQGRLAGNVDSCKISDSPDKLIDNEVNYPKGNNLIGLLFFLLIYFLTVRLGCVLISQPEGIASIWLVGGVALAGLLINPKRQWRVLLSIIFIANLLGNWGRANSPWGNLGFALADTFEAFLCAWALTYFSKSKKVTFERSIEVIVLLGLAVVCNGVTSLIVAQISVLVFKTSLFAVWLIRWAANGLGILLIAPSIVVWHTRENVSLSSYSRRLPEMLLLAFVLALFAWLLFGSFNHAEEPILRNYMLFPLLIWLAFRFELRDMANALLVFAVIAIWNTLQGHGIFSFINQSRTEHLISLQIYLSFASFSGFLLGAVVDERKWMEKILQTSEENFRNLAENTMVGILVVKPNGRHVYANRRASEILFYSPEELLQTSQKDIADPVAYPILQKRLQDRIAGLSVSNNYETVIRRKDGVNLPVEISGSRTIWHGEACDLVFFRDITERKQAEAALRESEEKYRRLFDNIDLAAFQSTPQGRAISVNAAFARMFGYASPEDAIQSIKDVSKDVFVDPNRRAEIIRMMAENPGMRTFENEYRRKDGGSFTGRLSTTRILDCDGNLVRIEGIIEDITERKRSEEALRASEEKYRLVANFTYDWEAWRAPNDKGYFYVSPSCKKITGYSAEEFIADANLIINITYPDDRASVSDHFRATSTHSDEEREFVFDFRIVTKAGEIRWLNHTCIAVYGNDGKWLGRRESNRDITARKQSEDVLRARLTISQFADTHSIDETLQYTLNEIEALTESKIGFFHGFDEIKRTITLQMWSTNTLQNMCTAEGKGQHYPIDQAGVWADCIYKREPILYNDYAALPHRKDLPKGHAPMERILVVPVFRNDMIVAILGIGNKPVNYDYQDIKIASHIADLIWDVILRKRSEDEVRQTKETLETKNSELNTALAREMELSHTDVLTGVHNRRYLFELAEREFDIAARHQLSLSIIMFDLDYFKKVNDTFGHDVGDHVLQRVTEAACAELRSADIIGRYGGEEFLIILPMTTAQQAYPVAERIRASVESLRVPTVKGDASVTLSMGIVEFSKNSASLDDLVRSADEAMYAAKQSGRNAISIFNRKQP